ncbi:MAG: ABC-F family ATP-binding cassette domain-containing protein, partial [Leptospiraceae bacterium]|nr:ABC-F family ATP-binding cassette domain-containing protein [Leptospiraceae bacterium]
MLQFISIRHQFGSTILFDGFSWHIKPGQKIALIGPNGSGKTTLFQIATKKINPDEGNLVVSKNTEISLFQQIPDFDLEKTVLETALISNKLYSEYFYKKKELDSKFDSVSHDSLEYEEILHEQSHLEDFAHAHDLHNLENRIQKILTGLGYSQESMNNPVKSFSPGYRHRLGLAIALINPHNLLLLDEPTNHLDDNSKLWLSGYLQETKNSFVLVTHDPEFLNATANTIAEISPGGVIEFSGSLEEFLEEKNELHEKLKARYKKEEAYLNKRMDWINRFRSKATKARQVQSAIKKLEKRDKVENPEDIFWNKKPDYIFNFLSAGKITFRLENSSFSYSDKDKIIFENTNLEVSNGEKIALVGPNGAGKSTLMRCILGQYRLKKGSLYYGPKTKIGYFSQVHSEELDSNLTVIGTILKNYPDISELAARNILGHFSFSGDKVEKKIGSLSGGEQSRVRLALLVLQPVNCLLLDEPTNHLDMVTRDALKRAIHSFEGSAVIISHDPDFLKGLCDKTLELSSGELKDLNCSFSDYLIYHKEAVSGDIEAKSEEKEISGAELQAKRNAEKNKLKRLEKEMNKLEEDISELETKRKEFEEKLNDPEFFNKPEYKEELDWYN